METRHKNRNLKKVVGGIWLPTVVLAVVLVTGYGIGMVRRNSEAISHPPSPSSLPPTIVEINPKDVTYEVFGTLDSGGKVAYADLNSRPIEVVLTSLPWSHSETTTSPSATLSLVAQVDGNSVGCRIIVNNEVRDEHSVSHKGAAVACTVAAA
ncbi:putative membrane protein, MmpS [Mycobacterium saskatchewanense]|nr:putative membrane protein, MmpS [Mycobacterium saskatchewanense]